MRPAGRSTNLPKLEQVVLDQIATAGLNQDFERVWASLAEYNPVVAKYILEQASSIAGDNLKLKNRIAQFAITIYDSLRQQVEVNNLNEHFDYLSKKIMPEIIFYDGDDES